MFDLLRDEPTDILTKVTHLSLIISNHARGIDLLETPPENGGIELSFDERELLDLIVATTEEIVPDYYDHNWPAFMFDFMQVVATAVSDHKAEDGRTDVIGDIEYWFDQIRKAGRLMLSPTHLMLFPCQVPMAA